MNDETYIRLHRYVGTLLLVLTGLAFAPNSSVASLLIRIF